MNRPKQTKGTKLRPDATQNTQSSTKSSTKRAVEALTQTVTTQSGGDSEKLAAPAVSPKKTEKRKKIKWVDRSKKNPESAISDGNCAYNSWAIAFGHNIDHFIEEASKEGAAERLPGLEKLIIKWNESNKSIHTTKFGRRVRGADGQMLWNVQGQALPFLNYIKERFQDVSVSYRDRSYGIQTALHELLRNVAIDERVEKEKEKFQYKSNFDAVVISIRNTLLASDESGALKAELDSRRIWTIPSTISYITQKNAYNHFASYRDVYELNTSGEIVDTDSAKTATPAEALTAMVLFLDKVATENMPSVGAGSFKNYLYEAFQACVTENSAQPLLTLLDNVHNKVEPEKGTSGNSYKLSQAEVEAAVDTAREYLNGLQCTISREGEEERTVSFAEFEGLFSSEEQSERTNQFETARDTVNTQIEIGIAGASGVDAFLNSVFENPQALFGASDWDNGRGTGISRVGGCNVRTRAEYDALPGALKAEWLAKASSLVTVWGQVDTFYSFVLNDRSLLSGVKRRDLSRLIDSTLNRDYLKDQIEIVLSGVDDEIGREATLKVAEFFNALNSDSSTESASVDEIREYLSDLTSTERAEITSALTRDLQVRSLAEISAKKEEYAQRFSQFMISAAGPLSNLESISDTDFREFIGSIASSERVGAGLRQVLSRHVREQMEALQQSLDEETQTKIATERSHALAYLFETPIEGVEVDTESRAKYQEILEPVLREIACSRSKIAQRDFYSALETQLPVSSETATAYYRGQEKLKQFWRDEGIDHYYDGMRQTARDGADSERWGSEIELGILCNLFNVNLHVEGSLQMNDPARSVTFHVAHICDHYYAYWKSPADLVSNTIKERPGGSTGGFLKIDARPSDRRGPISSPIVRRRRLRRLHDESDNISDPIAIKPDLGDDIEDQFGNINSILYAVGAFFIAIVSLIFWLALPPGINIIVGAITTGLSAVCGGLSVMYYWKSCQEDASSLVDPTLPIGLGDGDGLSDDSDLEQPVRRIRRRPGGPRSSPTDTLPVDHSDASSLTKASDIFTDGDGATLGSYNFQK